MVGTSGHDVALAYFCFSLEVLKTYWLDTTKSQDTNQSLSLTNWVYLQTKQHPELTDFLAELGFQKLSDWA